MSHELTNFVCDYCTLETASHDRELRVPFPISIFSIKLPVSTDSQRQCFGDSSFLASFYGQVQYTSYLASIRGNERHLADKERFAKGIGNVHVTDHP